MLGSYLRSISVFAYDGGEVNPIVEGSSTDQTGGLGWLVLVVIVVFSIMGISHYDRGGR